MASVVAAAAVRRVATRGVVGVVRMQSKSATNASAPAVPAAASDRAPVVPTSEHAKLGNIVSLPWNRMNVEDSDKLGLEHFRRTSLLSNATEEVKGRKAYVYKVSQHAMTSGFSSSKWWAVRLDASSKWTNPLMGYLSSADTAQQISQLNRFESAEQAVLFCERNGLEYEVQAPTERERGAVDSQYAYNFLPKEILNRMKTLGVRKSRPIFRNDTAPSVQGTSTFINFRYTQRGTESWKPRTDGTYAKGVAQTEKAWTGDVEWPAEKPKHDDGHH